MRSLRPWIILAHGAGAPSSHPWMQAWAARLATLGTVTTFDYDYVTAGRKAPDRLPALIAAHRRAIAAAGGDGPLVLAGKSMGGRIGCHVALEDPTVRALVCFGYPLVGARGDVRDAVLLALATPVLFVQGTRDALCPLAHLAEVRARMTAPSELHVVEGGDHSLAVSAAVRKARGRTQAEVDEEILGVVGDFLARRLAAG